MFIRSMKKDILFKKFMNKLIEKNVTLLAASAFFEQQLSVTS